jgi:hypothetical protein
VAGNTLHLLNGDWIMNASDGEFIRRYPVDEVHISISWKSYWFENVEAQRAFEQARGTLTIAEIERASATCVDAGCSEPTSQPNCPTSSIC